MARATDAIASRGSFPYAAAVTRGFVGLGTVLNVAAIVIGSLAGMAIGHRLPQRTREVVTDALGLITLLLAAISAAAVLDPSLVAAVGSGGAILVVLGALVLGGIGGSLLQIETRLGGLAGTFQTWLSRRSGSEGGTDHAARERFIEGWLTATLLFCVGPLAILGALSDGLGSGIDQLAVKSVMDGFAAMAFAASFGVGVLLSAAAVAVVQGLLTLAGYVLGQVVPPAPIAALTAVGGLLLVGIALRLLRIREIPVGDLLPAVVLAPLLTALVMALR